ncbi:hypothetical protein, partial [Rodentibacter trehalosifermentans]|uniref:hypothetical protein n=1 Tax=Rodentibacter trehalosifermentans TaxID=1908263 RepID=UPI0010566A9B
MKISRMLVLLGSLFIFSTSDVSAEISYIQNEIKNSKVYTYTSNTHKSKGLKLSLTLPNSWKGKDGKRPNVVQIFMDNEGKGLSSLTLLVRDNNKELAELLRATDPKDIKEMFSQSGNVRELYKVFNSMNREYVDSGYIMLE